MSMLNICSINVYFQDAPADLSHRPISLMYNIYRKFIFFSGSQFKKTGLENLEQSLYLCILWFWIWIKASNYQSYTFLNIALWL